MSDTPRIANEAGIELPVSLADKLAEQRPDPQSRDWADQVAAALDRLPHGVVVRISRLGLDDRTAVTVARHAVEAVTDALRRRWSLDALMPEYGEPQDTVVPQGQSVRSLLPHHDGGNCSYLTPSRLDVSDWAAEDRRTSVQSVTTTRMHKLYQGFFVRTVGDGESLTPYYEIVAMLMLSVMRRSRTTPVAIETLHAVCADHLRRAIALLRQRGGGYVQLSAILGARDPKHILVNMHNLQDGFSAAELSAFQDLGTLIYNGKTPAEQLFEEMIEETVGLSWSALRGRTELCLQTDRHDLVLGHNILLMHGGLRGGRARVLEPMCIVLPDSSGDAYERWLSAAWKTAYQRSVATLQGADPTRLQ